MIPLVSPVSDVKVQIVCFGYHKQRRAPPFALQRIDYGSIVLVVRLEPKIVS